MTKQLYVLFISYLIYNFLNILKILISMAYKYAIWFICLLLLLSTRINMQSTSTKRNQFVSVSRRFQKLILYHSSEKKKST